jgi:DNA primase catalytic core
MNFDIEKLKQISILDIANRLGIKVTRNKAMCFRGHDHRTPSLSFSPNKNLWHCFGCDIGGNNISLVKEYYKWSFEDASRWLVKEFNLTSDRYFKKSSIPRKIIPGTAKAENECDENTKPDEEVYECFYSNCSLSEKGKEYLLGRGYNIATINKFKIKDIINVKTMEKQLIEKFDKRRLLNSGLMVMRRDGLRLIWWDHTILFPFFEQEKIVYIQGRRLMSESPKYMGLSGISKPLYNHDVLRNLSKDSTVFICEGITDTLTAAQHYFNAVGVLGASSFRKKWVDDLNKFRIIVVPDNDLAGQTFEKKVKEIFLEKGHIIESVHVKRGKDLSNLLEGAKNVSH